MNFHTFFNIFDKQLKAVSTTRHGGVSQGNYASMNLCHYVGDKDECVKENRRLFCQHLGIKPEQLFLPYQTHSSKILNINNTFLSLSPSDQVQSLNGIDALITDKKQICISVSTADCVPVFLYDTSNQAIAIIHAGWRGTIAQIVTKTITLMKQTYNSNPADIFAAIGPCISQKNYEVGNDLYDIFHQSDFPNENLFIKNTSTTKWHLDLPEANRWLLLKAGIPQHQIELGKICTYDQSEMFFSARKYGIHSGRIASCIMLSE